MKEYRAERVCCQSYTVIEIEWDSSPVEVKVLMDNLPYQTARKIATMLKRAHSNGKRDYKTDLARRLGK